MGGELSLERRKNKQNIRIIFTNGYGSEGKESAYNSGDRVQSLGWEDLLEKEMATHFSILAWRIPRT